MITYRDTTAGVAPEQLEGFFEGWPAAPNPATHLLLLENSAHVVLAVDDDSGRVVGFVNAVGDGVLTAYIPLLEVLPEYRGRGIGRELARRMLARLSHFYMVDLVCDRGLVPFYRQFGMVENTGMMIRNPGRQSGGR
ncbi:MAG: GNAT family N-acetyltransferase [bacterium]|nr:GNAT family N-acetyltransferase [bacterium]